jgi:D-alanyl-D-alanine carboxypeptidase
MEHESGAAGERAFIRPALPLLLAAVFATSCASAPAPAAADASILDRVVGEAIRNREGVGAVVGLARDGQAPLLRAYGMANLEHQVPARPETVFWIASVTKQFTAAAIVMLADRGQLLLDDPLSKFLPEFPGARKVTLRHLLSHTSGVADAAPPADEVERIGRLMDDASINEQIRRIAASDPLFEFEPGTAWHYSNAGYILLGAVVERASGDSFEDFLRINFFEPLGMLHTAVDDMNDVVPHRAHGYVPSSTDPSGFLNARPVSRIPAGPAGFLRSTAGDLLRWQAALFNGTLVSRDRLEEMVTPARLNDGRRTSEGLVPEIEERRMGRPYPDYGLGFFIEQHDERRVVGHSGRFAGFNATVHRYQDEGLTLVILTNTSSFAQRLLPRIARELFHSSNIYE